MTRILHTSDLHLREGRPRRWAALDAVLVAAAREKADAVLVAGDLLDRREDHAALRARVRERMDRSPVPVHVLPGNHDRGAYSADQDWGRRVRLLLREPVETVEIGDIRVAAVPFPADPVPFARIVHHLEEEMPPEGAHVLALHATLVDASTPRIQEETRGEEPGPWYFPVHLEDLADLPVSYVALGHYHQHDLRRVDGTRVAYSGAPAPVGPHALGPRSVLLVEIDPGDGSVSVERVRLPVPYRRRMERWLTPFSEERDLEALGEELREAADEDCEMEVVLDGVLAGITEVELRDATEGLADELGEAYGSLSFEARGVGLDPARAELFRQFQERLEEALARDPEAAAGAGAAGAAAMDAGATDAAAPRTVGTGGPGDADTGDRSRRLRQRALELVARALKA